MSFASEACSFIRFSIYYKSIRSYVHAKKTVDNNSRCYVLFETSVLFFLAYR